VAVDMNPEDNYRKQKNMGAANYGKYRNMADFGYSLQFVRNTLQVSQGLRPSDTDTLPLPVFSDIAYYAGVAATDWSWTPSVADFDNDGWRDLLITNGYPRDITDHDFISYRRDKGYIVSDEALLQQIPEIKVSNYAFRNTEQLVFENVSAAWGLDDDAYSTGAAYADLDNDGDLDYVINNINAAASLYENRTDPLENENRHFIRLQFKGDGMNRDAIGAKAIVYAEGAPHLFENFPTRGYLSSVEGTGHIGLGKAKAVDSIRVQWPNGRTQTIFRPALNQTITLDVRHARPDSLPDAETAAPALFSSLNAASGMDFTHSEFDFIDFDYQRLLPHKLSEYGPALAAGDVDGNGLDDIFLSGPKGTAARFFLQQPDGRFVQKPLQSFTDPQQKPFEELGSLLLDIDNDHDLDLYLCSGSNEFKNGDEAFRDRIFLNDGKGNFLEIPNVLPHNRNSKQVLKSADFDQDGDLDLFIGSRSVPNEYPRSASGYLYRNDSRPGAIRFTDITGQVAPELKNVGMITDAAWSDFDNDGQVDLVICGEFMAVHFLKNQNGRFKRTNAGVDAAQGLWNSITPADINNDGNMDYIAGNLGLNSFYQGSAGHPFEVYGGDFDGNGSFDALPFLFLKDNKGRIGQYPAFTRDDMMKQLIRIKGQFATYKDFAGASLTDILTAKERKNAVRVSANYFQSAVFLNNGNGTFSMAPLPFSVQWSPVYGILPDDFDGDGNIDLLLNTNDLGTEVNTGQYDALNGVHLKGDGKGNFVRQPYPASGFFVPSNGKALVKFIYQNRYAVAGSQNRGRLELFQLNTHREFIRLRPEDAVIQVYLKNGQVRREEACYGHTFL
ncbi:MAG TPA: VCBS repeat-containing protein, partial [Chitinophagaceae bacterium]|nr:VCBS repeat-containing protein [Chitinophagaceae bacterium]